MQDFLLIRQKKEHQYNFNSIFGENLISGKQS